MDTETLSHLETEIGHLSFIEQIWLMERLAQRIRQFAEHNQSAIENQLVEMANDPNIQHELQMIDEEFAIAEADGLEKTL